MKKINTRVFTDKEEKQKPSGIFRHAGIYYATSLILVLCTLILAGSAIAASKTKQGAIKIDGETVTKANLEIYSDTQGECAVSVSNGGKLTLTDSTITKIGEDREMGGQGGMPGGQGDMPEGRGGMPGTQGQSDGEGGPPQMPGGQEGMQGQGQPGGQMGMPGEQGQGQPGEQMAMPGGDPGAGGPGGGGPGGMQQGQPGPGAQNSGVYASSESAAILANVNINTKLGEGKGLYASGAGSAVSLSNGTITTNGNTAHGVYITYGGTITLKDTSITTQGAHSSVLATDKGGGIITAENGTYIAHGDLSAGIYSTGLVKVSNSVFRSESDNVAVIEGGNEIYLDNCTLTAVNKPAVMIYQSFSGDAAVGKADFTMIGGSLKTEDKEGAIFYVTNTATTINIKNVALSGVSGILLEAIKGQWGADAPGADRGASQGGDVDFYAEEQKMVGDIIADEYGTVRATLKCNSSLKGAINPDGKGKEVNLYLDGSSTWEVTADSYLNRIRNSDGISAEGVSNIIGNGHTVYYNGNANSALSGRTFKLKNGGTLQPK